MPTNIDSEKTERYSSESPGRLLIVGDPRGTRRLVRNLKKGPWLDLPVVGFIDAGHDAPSGPRSRSRQFAVRPESDPVPILGTIDDLEQWVDRAKPTHLVVALRGRSLHRIRRHLEIISKYDVSVHWIADGDVRLDIPAKPRERPNRRLSRGIKWERAAKRLVDFLGAAIGLVLLSPLFLVVSIMILITSGRPIFYTQVRIGQGGRNFRMIKFRSMGKDAEGATGPIWASEQDARCTKVGLWLRRANIDELPQLINVLKGEMSLVGPRPERPMFVDRFRVSIPDYDLRHAMPGGMTGWAQVHGWRGRTSLRKRVQYDLDYIRRWSFWLDLKVLFMTYEHVVFGKISWKKPVEGSKT